MMADEKISNYIHYIVLPMKFGGCWDWFPKPKNDYEIVINNVYICMVLFVLSYVPTSLIVNLYTEWVGMLGSVDKIADGLPVGATVLIVAYFALYKEELYELVDFMNDKFVFYSARGLTNMTMYDSYLKAKKFALFYTVCVMFSVTMYVVMPVIGHFWLKVPLQESTWIYMDVTRRPFYVIAFLRQTLGQWFLGLALGQFGVFFAVNSIIICGQLDLLCCSLRNVRYTALLQQGVAHSALVTLYSDLKTDELYNYAYSEAEMVESDRHFDQSISNRLTETRTRFDIYSEEFDEATSDALRDCARICRVIKAYKIKFESFVSPLLVLRVVQVTLFICTLLYAATLNFDISTVEYLGAVCLDMFIYCYFGNQIILQADRVTTAAYQSAWHTMGTKPRRLLLNILLDNRRPMAVRAGHFLSMDLQTYIAIIKTSFSYYTLLVNLNNKKN